MNTLSVGPAHEWRHSQEQINIKAEEIEETLYMQQENKVLKLENH